ncbi:MAG: glycosyltransferase family 4 protein, partial [Roseiflexaceae bacterium]|nr:glycosyltransferase family 4 protein [Roseiflexaceae bacterium]
MNIAIDARYVADHFPGIGRYTYNLIRALAELKTPHQLHVLHNPALRNTRFDLESLATLPGLQLVPTAARTFSLAEQARIPALLRRLRADVYHAPYYLRPYVALPCRSVTTLYDAIPRLFPADVSPRARLLFDTLTRLAIRSSYHILTISQSALNDFTSMYQLDPRRATVTPLAADARFRPQPPWAIAAVRAKYGLITPYVLSLASNKPHKNLPLLVEAWSHIQPRMQRRVVLVIAGHYDARYPQARERAAQLSLAESIQFIENVDDQDLAPLYAGAQLFAFPSRYEGFGLPPLEALACGTPVLCGNTSSLPEVMGDAALLVDVTSLDVLAASLLQLLG